MDEQKRLILAIVLSVIVLVGYQYFFVKPPDPATFTEQARESAEKPALPPEKAPNVSDFSVQETPSPEPVEPLAAKSSRTISIDTPLYQIEISEQGAAVKNFALKNYKASNQDNAPLKQLVTDTLTDGVFLLDLSRQSISGLKTAVYTAQMDMDHLRFSSGEKTLAFTAQTPQGIVVKKIFTFRADSYMINCDIVLQNGSAMPLNDAITITIPGHYDKEVKSRSRFAFEGPLAFVNKEFLTIKPDDIEEQDTYTGNIEWIGYSERYFMTTVMPRQVEGTPLPDMTLKLSYADNRVTSSLVYPMDRLDPGKQGVYPFTFYMGPKSQKILGDYDNSLKAAVNFGFFNMLAKPLLIIMNTIHDYIPNYGIAIILLTIFIKLVFWPLGTKSYKSMNAMKKLQPLMMELREKYKDDKQRMNTEIMGLYKTYKVNPAGGCLPILVQMPIFFALYRMLYQAIELRHAPFVGWISDLSAPDRLLDFNFAIPMMQAPYGIPMLTLLMGASFLLQQKMTPVAGDPMQAKIMMLMPVFMTVIFINFPAGLVLYMLVNNIISMGQQYYIQKKFS